MLLWLNTKKKPRSIKNVAKARCRIRTYGLLRNQETLLSSELNALSKKVQRQLPAPVVTAPLPWTGKTNCNEQYVFSNIVIWQLSDSLIIAY